MAATRQADAGTVATALHAHWPHAACELMADSPWSLLMAVMCSTRTPDARVNAVMPALMAAYPQPGVIADADPREVDDAIRQLPLHAQKARALVECGRAIAWYHNGNVPADPEILATLPGIGRKIAAVVAGNAFGVPTVATDSHVIRIVHRLGWTARAEAAAVEAAMRERLPEAAWVRHCHQLIRLGREHCRPRRPFCSRCPLADTCPRVGVSEAR